jgi:hypothetical protein
LPDSFPGVGRRGVEVGPVRPGRQLGTVHLLQLLQGLADDLNTVGNSLIRPYYKYFFVAVIVAHCPGSATTWYLSGDETWQMWSFVLCQEQYTIIKSGAGCSGTSLCRCSCNYPMLMAKYVRVFYIFLQGIGKRSRIQLRTLHTE